MSFQEIDDYGDKNFTHPMKVQGYLVLGFLFNIIHKGLFCYGFVFLLSEPGFSGLEFDTPKFLSNIRQLSIECALRNT